MIFNDRKTLRKVGGVYGACGQIEVSIAYGGDYFVPALRILSYWGIMETFCTSELGGLAPPPNPLLGWGAARPGPLKSRGLRPLDPIAIPLMAREHEARLTRNTISNRTFSDRPLPTCKRSVVVTATIFTSSKANKKETTVEVARPKSAPSLF